MISLASHMLLILLVVLISCFKFCQKYLVPFLIFFYFTGALSTTSVHNRQKVWWLTPLVSELTVRINLTKKKKQLKKWQSNLEFGLARPKHTELLITNSFSRSFIPSTIHPHTWIVSVGFTSHSAFHAIGLVYPLSCSTLAVLILLSTSRPLINISSASSRFPSICSQPDTTAVLGILLTTLVLLLLSCKEKQNTLLNCLNLNCPNSLLLPPPPPLSNLHVFHC